MKMFENRKVKGAISIFLVIITIPTMLFAAVLIDGSRMASARAMTQEATDLAAASALASYNQELKDTYGLFAINDNSQVEAIYKQSLANTLMAYGFTDNGDYTDRIWEILKSQVGRGNPYKGQSFLNLYDFSVEDCKVTPMYSLANWQVLENQMVEYSKFRGLYVMADRFGIISTLEQAKEQAEKNKEAAEAMSEKMDVDEKNMALDQALQKLRDAVRALNTSNSAVKNQKDTYVSALNAQMEVIKYSNIDSDKQLDSSVEHMADSYNSSQNALAQELQQLPNLAKAVLEAAKTSETERAKAVQELTEFKNAYSSKAAGNDSISEMIRDANDAIEEYEGRYKNEIATIQNDAVLKELSEDSSLESDISGILQEIDTAIYKDEERIKEERKKAKENDEDIEITEYFYYYLGLGDKSEAASEVLYGSSAAGCYEPTIYDRMAYFSEKVWEEINPTLDRANENSGTSSINQETAKEQSEKAKSTGDSDDSGRGKVDDSVYQARPSKNFDASKEASMTGGFYSSDGNLSGAKNMLKSGEDSMLLKIGEAARDDILCLSYMFGTFKTRLTGSDKFTSNMPVSEKNSFYMPDWRYAHEEGEIDMRFSPKKERDTVLRSEIEYMICGFASDQANEDSIYALIFSERLTNNIIALNAVTSVKTSCKIAAAVSSALTQGTVPETVFYWIFLAAWATSETFMEMDYLLEDGYKIPLVKTKNNVLLNDVPFGDRKQKISNYGQNGIFVSYEDYLLIMLLLRGEQNRLMRSADLIEMNMKRKDAAFTMAEAYTYLKADTEMSLRYLFGSVSPFQSEYEKNGVTGRMRFSNTIYQGY